MAIPIPEESCTADENGKTISCDSEQQPPEEPPPEQPQPEQPQPQEPQEQPEAVPEGIRTTPIPIPGSQAKQQQSPQQQQQQQPQQQQQAQPQSGGGGPGMRNLVRFLNNPEGVIASNDSAYLRTMYSSDSADLVYKSAMNSGSYY